MAKRKPMSSQSKMTPKTRYQPNPASVPVGSSMYGGTMDIPGSYQSKARPTGRVQYQPPAPSIPIASHKNGGTIDIPGRYQSVKKPAKSNATKMQEMILMRKMRMGF
jgi:hypothetical protein